MSTSITLKSKLNYTKKRNLIKLSWWFDLLLLLLLSPSLRLQFGSCYRSRILTNTNVSSTLYSFLLLEFLLFLARRSRWILSSHTPRTQRKWTDRTSCGITSSRTLALLQMWRSCLQIRWYFEQPNVFPMEISHLEPTIPKVPMTTRNQLHRYIWIAPPQLHTTGANSPLFHSLQI